MKEVTLTLTEQEAQSVLSGLAKFPFEQVAQLINKIAAQLQPQTTLGSGLIPDPDAQTEEAKDEEG